MELRGTGTFAVLSYLFVLFHLTLAIVALNSRQNARMFIDTESGIEGRNVCMWFA